MISSSSNFARSLATLSLPLLLAACQGNQAAPKPGLYNVSGTLIMLNPSAQTTAQVYSPWTGGAGSMQAVDAGGVLSTGAVASSGSFNLTLPASLADSDLGSLSDADLDLSSANCAGSLQISNQAARTTVVDFKLLTATGSRFAAPIEVQVDVKPDGSGQYSETDTLLIYSDSATRINGQQQCINNGSTLVSTYAINLKAGYNVVNQTLVLNSDASGTTNSTIRLANGKSPPRWAADAESATPLSLKASALSSLTPQLKQLFH